MRHWFQNLKKEDREKRLFNFRGSVRTERRELFSYSAWSGPSLRLEMVHGSGDERATSLWLGLGFFTLVVTVPLPDRWYFKRKCIATWDNNREFYLIDDRKYGFYFYEWAIVWHWHQRENESGGRQPWWRHFYFQIDDFLLGRTEYMSRDICTVNNIGFNLGGKEFVMDSITWQDDTWFRRRIPLSLHEKRMVRVDMKIAKPPMRAGKGENSWDCGDDGSFGLLMPWDHEPPTYLGDARERATRKAVDEYVKHVLKDAKRYGGGDGERGVRSTDAYEYLGPMQAKGA